MDQFLSFLDESKFFRRAGYCAMWFVVFAAFYWSIGYADAALAAGQAGVDTAAIIGAIWLPLSGLAGHMFRTYSDNRSNDSGSRSS